MEPGEKLLALTLEYRDAIVHPQICADHGLPYDGRSTAEIGAEYESLIRQVATGRE